MKKILRIKIERDRVNRIIKLSQIIYIKKILKGLDIKEDRYKKKAIILLNGYNKILPTNPDEKRINKTNYTRVIEKLIYIIIYIRPNIIFAFRKLS